MAFLVLLGLVIWFPILVSNSQKKESDELIRKGRLVQATVVEVNDIEDVVLKYELMLPDGKTVQRGSDILPYGSKIKTGDKVIVRYNPMLPAVSRYVERDQT